MAEGPAPATKPEVKTPELTKPWKKLCSVKERGKFAHQVIEVSPPTSGELSPGAPDTDGLRHDEGEDNPMVWEAIHPFAILSRIVAPKTGAQREVDTIIDTGCTRCLIKLPTVLKMGIRTKTMTQPIRFEQVDGSLMGGGSSTLLTEPVKLEMGQHRELIRFVVSPKMREAMNLGLSWLDKWSPTILWEGGYRKLRLGIGPNPPEEVAGEAAK